MEKISKTIEKKISKLNEKHYGQLKRKRTHYFYMPDEFVEKYLPAIKECYNLTLARNVGLIYMALSRRSNFNGFCFPGYTLLMKESLISNRNTLISTLVIMRDKFKMLDWETGTGKSSNVYQVFDVMHWAPISSIKNNSSSINTELSSYHLTDTRSTVLKEDINKEEKNNSKALTILPCRSLLVVSHK